MLTLEKPLVQTLWIGKPTKLLHLTINSFLHHGHEVHLYCYEKMYTNAKEKDANDIIEFSQTFKASYPGTTNSYSTFANMFRYAMLSKHGSYWVDADTVCLQKFNFDIVFSSEGSSDCPIPNIGVLKYENLAFWKEMFNESISQNSTFWGQTGGYLLRDKLNKYNLNQYIATPNTFCPVHYPMFKSLFTENLSFDSNVYSVHLWNEMMKRYNISESEMNNGWLGTQMKKYLL